MINWEFNSVMNCDKCKFNHQCNMEPDCPYIQGWKDGQRKILSYLLNPLHPSKDGHTISADILQLMLKDMDKSIVESDKGKLIDRGSFAKYVEEK